MNCSVQSQQPQQVHPELVTGAALQRWPELGQEAGLRLSTLTSHYMWPVLVLRWLCGQGRFPERGSAVCDLEREVQGTHSMPFVTAKQLGQ